MALESFNAYYSYLETMELLDDAECGRLFRALLVYSMTGSAPQLCGNERFVFPGMRAQIDRDKTKYSAKCEKNRANVQQRRNTSGEEAVPSDTNEYDRTGSDTNEYDRTETYTNEYDRTETYTNDTKDKDKDKGKDKDKDNDRDKGEDRDKDRDKDFSKDKGEGKDKDRDAYAPVRETAGRFRAPSVSEAYVYDARGRPRDSDAAAEESLSHRLWRSRLRPSLSALRHLSPTERVFPLSTREGFTREGCDRLRAGNLSVSLRLPDSAPLSVGFADISLRRRESSPFRGAKGLRVGSNACEPDKHKPSCAPLGGWQRRSR